MFRVPELRVLQYTKKTGKRMVAQYSVVHSILWYTVFGGLVLVGIYYIIYILFS